MANMSKFAATIVLGVIVTMASACTDADTPIFIMQNQVPDVGCLPPASLGSTFLPRGRIDTNAGDGYRFTPLVQNIATSGDTAAQHVAFIEGADIELSFQSGFFSAEEVAARDEATQALYSLLTRFSKRFSGAIQPNGGLTSFVFTIIPEQLLTDFAAPKLSDDGTQTVEVRAKVASP